MPDWEVVVYKHGAPVAGWIISNRTESEAEKEAMNDVQNGYPDCHDWTLMEVEAT